MMASTIRSDRLLVSAEIANTIDEEAQLEWGFNIFALIEAAGRCCAEVFAKAFPKFFQNQNKPRVTIVAGTGNNGVDAMVMLRYWILAGLAEPSSSALVLNRLPKDGESSPRSELIKSLRKMKVRILIWDGDLGEAVGRASDDVLAHSDIIVDGIAGTGTKGALNGAALEMAQAVNTHRAKTRAACGQNPARQIFVVSVDIPSGNSDSWEPEMPIIEADLTLAIEPLKACMYTPAARPYAGIILPVTGIFPQKIISRYDGTELLDWEEMRERIPTIRPDAYKNERGTVELWAGSPGFTGAALIAARGAQAAGAGLVCLMADDDIHPILASRSAGIMVFPAGKPGTAGFGECGRPADAILLGPGWGVKPERTLVLERSLLLEKKGTPLILDADAIELAHDKSFNGNVILTPHPGEFSKFSGVGKEKLLCCPTPILLKYARDRKAVILFKGHVLIIVAPDGRVGVVDGMTPALATGGSGDLLAGFCAAIAARMVQKCRPFDAYTCAAAAASLLIASGSSRGLRTRFCDPLELAGRAADLAGQAWLRTNHLNLQKEDNSHER